MTSDTMAPESTEVARYRALSSAAVISLVFGILSILTALWWPMVLIPAAGVFLGLRAQRRIRESPEEWTGLSLAQWGIQLSIILGIAGLTFLYFTSSKEITFGYEYVTFDMLQSDPNKPTELVPDAAKIRDDKKVFIRGYMRPRRVHSGIKEFIMAATTDDCPTCVPNPRPTDSIRVILSGDRTTAFTTHQIGVAGKLHIEPSMPGGLPYTLEDAEIRSR